MKFELLENVEIFGSYKCSLIFRFGIVQLLFYRSSCYFRKNKYDRYVIDCVRLSYEFRDFWRLIDVFQGANFTGFLAVFVVFENAFG